ncbi:hypothetical protein P3T18_004864 [Paraburkholderia sp. GAS199]
MTSEKRLKTQSDDMRGVFRYRYRAAASGVVGSGKLEPDSREAMLSLNENHCYFEIFCFLTSVTERTSALVPLRRRYRAYCQSGELTRLSSGIGRSKK